MRTAALLCIVTLTWAASSALAQGDRAARVVVAEVFEETIAPTTRIVGAVDFDKRSGISPEVSGLVASHAMEEGAVVRKGDVLVRLSTEFIEKDIAIREKEAEAIGIRIANARKNLDRYKTLLKGAAASEKAYDDLAFGLRELVINREKARQEIARLELQKEKSTIKAPYDGLILERYANEGEWVAPGTPVCDLGAIDALTVRVAVSEELVRYIETGQLVNLTINALGRELEGKVTGIVPVADPASKTLQVKIAIPYFDEAVQNLSVSVDVPSGTPRTLSMIKRDALVRNAGKELIYTVKDGQAEIMPVSIVGYAGEMVGVDNAQIQPGMPVVIDGNDRLRPGQAVEIIETRTFNKSTPKASSEAPEAE